ncbi:hypothetical protein BIW11_08451 [Tropilaelaps mercedesae]|uniref:C3H1-type domain-containing protein n=1 Tax=Tropilaelaps mercedesae TaxID=418985 RepID=A0A1V9XPF3_9ACAR|nr:hypothetical protein BIW11_08451 [Tropilaelaps mercedesae]
MRSVSDLPQAMRLIEPIATSPTFCSEFAKRPANMEEGLEPAGGAYLVQTSLNDLSSDEGPCDSEGAAPAGHEGHRNYRLSPPPSAESTECSSSKSSSSWDEAVSSSSSSYYETNSASSPESTDEEEGEIVSDEEATPQAIEPPVRSSPAGQRQTASTGGFAPPPPRGGPPAAESRPVEEKKPLSIGDIAERIQQQNAMLLASEMDRLHQQKHEEDRARKRHHKKDKRRRRAGSYSSEEGLHSPHRKHVGTLSPPERGFGGTKAPGQSALARLGRKRRHERKRSRSRSRSPPVQPTQRKKKQQQQQQQQHHQQAQEDSARPPCKYYQEGKCNKTPGEDCPYSHAVEQTKRAELCRFYVSGHCVKRNCPFMHEDFPCKFYHSGAPCFADKNCRYSHAPLTDDMRDVLMKYLDECKGLKREDLERLSRKAKEREVRHQDSKSGHREPLLELPPSLDQEDGPPECGPNSLGSGSAFTGGDVDLRISIPPGGVNPAHPAGDMDYRLPGGDRDSRLQLADQDERLDRLDKNRSPPRAAFYRDTIESPRTRPGSPGGRRTSFDTARDRSPNGARRRSSESSDSKRSDSRRLDDDQRRFEESTSKQTCIERPSDPRERLRALAGQPPSQLNKPGAPAENSIHMASMSKTQRDLLMRLQQRADNNSNLNAQLNQDSQGSSVEEGGRTPMADEDIGGGELSAGGRSADGCGAHPGDEDSDEDLTHVLKRLQQEPKRDMAPAAASSAGGIDLVKIISSIASSSSPNTQSFMDQPADYWKRVLSIAGVDPATGTPSSTSTAGGKPQPGIPSSPSLNFGAASAASAPAGKTDPRRRDPRQQPAGLQGSAMTPPRDNAVAMASLPIFPKLEVTAVIESRDGDAPYIFRQIDPAPAPVRYEQLVHLVEMNFRLKTDPRLVRHLEKLPRKEEIVDTPQSPPPQQQQMLQPGGNYMPPLVPPLVPPMVGLAATLGPMGNLPGGMVGNMSAVLGGPSPVGKTPLLPLPSLPPINLSPMQTLVQDPRSKADPRLSRDPRSQSSQGNNASGEPSRMVGASGLDPRAVMDPVGFQQRMPCSMGPINPAMGGAMPSMGDPRRACGFPGPRQQIDPRQAARAAAESRQFNGPPRQAPAGSQPGSVSGSATGPDQPMAGDLRQKADPRANRNDPRQKRDPRAKEQPPPAKDDQQPSPQQQSVEDTPSTRPKMTYSSPLSAYDDGAQENTYTRRTIGRIKKKNQSAKTASAQPPATPTPPVASTEDNGAAVDSEKLAPASLTEPPTSAEAAPADVGSAALPPPPSLLSHPVDPYAPSDDKPLSEMFKTKDPTASPFN